MKILGIETSCDETAVAVVEGSGGLEAPLFEVRSSVVSSQIKEHVSFGGVVPNIAKREHARNLVPVLEKALRGAGLYNESGIFNLESGVTQDSRFQILDSMLARELDLIPPLKTLLQSIAPPEIDAIAVTRGPGLEPALWVGVNFARALACAWEKPLYAVNHMEGHILAALLHEKTQNTEHKTPKVEFPILSLLVSGGHTELDVASAWGKYEVLGETRDDAVGEAFDKVARLLGLPYPGGPAISALAEMTADKRGLDAEQRGKNPSFVSLPRPMINSGDLDFSFSGLKTAVRYRLEKEEQVTDEFRATMALEFERAAVEVLLAKTCMAMLETGAKTFILGGGVAANTRLRREVTRVFADEFPEAVCILPDRALTTDNAAMIAAAGYIRSLVDSPADPLASLEAVGKLRLGGVGDVQ